MSAGRADLRPHKQVKGASAGMQAQLCLCRTQSNSFVPWGPWVDVEKGAVTQCVFVANGAAWCTPTALMSSSAASCLAAVPVSQLPLLTVPVRVGCSVIQAP